jgi:hypothetical protein
MKYEIAARIAESVELFNWLLVSLVIAVFLALTSGGDK